MAENETGSPLIDPAVIAANLGLTKEKTPATEQDKNRRSIPDRGGFIWGTGRRKSSVARVRIKPGEGKLIINKRELGDYFNRVQDKDAVMAPLAAANVEKSFDIFVNVQGGGSTGQSGAIRLGIARALVHYDESMLDLLRSGGHLTRDGRMVERKKPGQPGARKSFQFSKR